jgi:hypothetical protein
MQLPAIHSNGTGKATLLREYRKGVEKVDDAIAAVRDITVHGRDYYIIGPEAGSVAMEEHRDRLKRLEAVKDDLVAIWHHIDRS